MVVCMTGVQRGDNDIHKAACNGLHSPGSALCHLLLQPAAPARYHPRKKASLTPCVIHAAICDAEQTLVQLQAGG